ncbi:type II secretion system F family protein [Streptomyces sp. LP05-1]|uniref:Type II secretion system F family protein n=1 Tax=Streptomyces pyxinae TaxID=2970734 RepID=A0ABT2CPB2_9ACTN|nr:type II secretion system F family protein [Streptomyces sp. LP05-1]MCS0639264.1 type II secretion system F family protein [Streptomyces sp. LP05-1]
MTGGSASPVALVLTVSAGWLWAARSVSDRRAGHRVRHRGGALLGRPARRGAGRRPAVGAMARARGWAAPLGAAITVAAVVGGASGGLLGAVAAWGVRGWLRRSPPAPDETAQDAERRLPLAADLLAACLSAGAGPQQAADAVGRSLGGPLGDRLARAAAELRLGGEPTEAWARLGALPGAGPLARCLERADASGAPAADGVARLATGLRAERGRRGAARAQRAQVLMTAPVGLCFLPAFLAVGVAPVVVGLASGLL